MDAKTRLARYRHDLRNHLSVIRLYTELLSAHLAVVGCEDKKTRSYIEIILRRSHVMEDALMDLKPGKFTSLSEGEAYTQTLEPKQ